MVSIEPRFEARKDTLVAVGKSTCYIGSRIPNEDIASGTAFFVGPTTLLTAGHMAPAWNTRVRAQLPGTKEALSFVDELFESENETETFPCRCIATLYPQADISILDSTPYRSETWLVPTKEPLKRGEAVDIVGYPGLYSDRYIKTKHGRDVKIDSGAIHDIQSLLPKCKLTVTHGPVVNGAVASYKVSTIAGMSGGPVIVNGKCVGKLHLNREFS
jgi:hypothetical protein